MTAITLTLPYPISANTYWRHTARHGFAQTLVSKEAKAYKAEVALVCRIAEIRTPISGRVAIGIKLYPHRPKDFLKRMRLLGDAWSDTVQCIDLDNANKVLLDALKGIAIDDDKWVRRITSERMEPDEHGSRVVVTITPMQLDQPQTMLPMTAPDLLAGVAVHQAMKDPF
jgi:crossover junction endodeoxyribonuclease RusA